MQLEKSLAAHVPTSALFATDSQSSSNDPCNVKSENKKSLPRCLHIHFEVPIAEALVDFERRTLTLSAEAAVKAPVACSE